MPSSARCVLLGLLSAPICLLQTAKSPPSIKPEIAGVFPHGGQRGTVVELRIRGKNLHDTARIQFASRALRAVILESQFDTVRARFEVGSSAEPGRHDFRLIAPHGSASAWFTVSSLREIVEIEPSNALDQAQVVELPVLVNGIIKAGDYDFFKFSARAGQALVVDVNATRNGSTLDSQIAILDQNGSSLAKNDDYYMFKDPHLEHKFERAGTYYLRIYGHNESGSDYGDYRLTVGELPYISRAMPCGGRRGEMVELQLRGESLSEIQSVVLGDRLADAEIVSIQSNEIKVRLRIPPHLKPGVYQLHAVGALNAIPFLVSQLPEATVAKGEARSRKDPFPVELPVIVNGVLEQRGSADHFSFRVDRPQHVLLEVQSMQMGFMLDPVVLVYDDLGNHVAYQDDPTTNTSQDPANIDPHLVVFLPRAGQYVARVRDNYYRGQENFLYRLTIKPAEPDFFLAVLGTDETLYRGRENRIVIRVRRLQGWDAPVEVWADNLPPGVRSERMVVSPKDTEYKGGCGELHHLDGTNVEVPLFVSEDAEAFAGPIRFQGRGEILGRAVEHEAVARYSWKSKTTGYAQTAGLFATVADSPKLIINVPERVSVSGSQGSIKVIVERFDDDRAPVTLGAARQIAGLWIEPVQVSPGQRLAEVKVRATTASNYLVLVGRVNGKVLGQSRPITVELAGTTP